VAATDAYRAIMQADFRFFLTLLDGPNGQPLRVAPHHERWCRLLVENERLVILAPRDHGKTTVSAAYALWRLWRHGRSPRTGRPGMPGARAYQVAVFSATHQQAQAFLAVVHHLATANGWLFRSTEASSPAGEPTIAWSRSGARLASGAEIVTRAFRTSTRGLHPDVLLCDDILSDANSGTQLQRDRTWEYFTATLLPMHAKQVIVLGTAQHAGDLLFRLGPPGVAEGSSETATLEGPYGFRWVRYRALDEETETALWPWKHSAAELLKARADGPIVFSREYQNEPIDDAASLFPCSLTDTLKVADATFLPFYQHGSKVAVILGLDIARGESAGADYTVQMIVAYDQVTQKRRLLYARRAQGLDFRQQLTWLREVMGPYSVDMAVVEDNGFQKWLFQESRRYTETAGKVISHRTGQEKADLDEGVPALKLAFLNGLWELPVGDQESAGFFAWWQAEHAAFGWKDGKLQGVGDHDDTVMATWFVERGIRTLQQWLGHAHDDEIVYGEDLGFEPVHISPDLDALDAALGFESPGAARLRRLLQDE
jgi:hypothetical protein